MHDRVEIPDNELEVRTMFWELSPQVKPVDGETATVRPTAPTNPLILVTVIVEVPGVPEKTTTLVGLALTAKSCTV